MAIMRDQIITMPHRYAHYAHTCGFFGAASRNRTDETSSLPKKSSNPNPESFLQLLFKSVCITLVRQTSPQLDYSFPFASFASLPYNGNATLNRLSYIKGRYKSLKLLTIIVRERKDDTGQIFFGLYEQKSGKYRKWTPSPDMDPLATEFALSQVVEDFNKEICDEFHNCLAENNSNQNPRQTPIASLTLAKYIQEYFWPRKTVVIAENTRDCWERHINARILPQMGHLRLGTITTAIITDFLIGIQGEGLSHASVQKYYTILRSIFKMACNIDKLNPNPMLTVEKPTRRKDELIQTCADAYTADKIVEISNLLLSAPLKWRTMFCILEDTGIRRGEACGLTWDKVDFQNMTIEITGNLCYTKAKGIFLDTPKSKRKRVISVSPEVMQLLLLMYAESKKAPVQSEFVFSQRNKPVPMNPTSVTGYFAKIRKKYNIDKFHPHILRHTFASIAITNGADIASISEILGHSDKSVTLRMYTEANLDSMKKAATIQREAVQKARNNISHKLKISE